MPPRNEPGHERIGDQPSRAQTAYAASLADRVTTRIAFSGSMHWAIPRPLGRRRVCRHAGRYAVKFGIVGQSVNDYGVGSGEMQRRKGGLDWQPLQQWRRDDDCIELRKLYPRRQERSARRIAVPDRTSTWFRPRNSEATKTSEANRSKEDWRREGDSNPRYGVTRITV